MHRNSEWICVENRQICHCVEWMGDIRYKYIYINESYGFRPNCMGMEPRNNMFMRRFAKIWPDSTNILAKRFWYFCGQKWNLNQAHSSTMKTVSLNKTKKSTRTNVDLNITLIVMYYSLDLFKHLQWHFQNVYAYYLKDTKIITNRSLLQILFLLLIVWKNT